MNFLDESGNIDETTLEVNVTSFIDVLFVLLLFFMVTTNFDDARGLRVNLPTSRSGATSEEPQKINLQLNETGEISVDGLKTTMADLGTELDKLKQQKPEAILVLRADKSVSHGVVVQAMDEASSHGLGKIAIATSPGSATAP